MDFFNVNFWQGFVGNLLATIIGVAVGIPIAFWISNQVESRTEQEKKKKILRLLANELSVNKIILTAWEEGDNARLTTIGLILEDETWSAFSDGGELEWVKDTQLLYELARTFAQIKRVKYLSDKYLNFRSMPESTNNLILRELTSGIGIARDDVIWTLNSISKALNEEIKPPPGRG